jgi:hypothetical protein
MDGGEHPSTSGAAPVYKTGSGSIVQKGKIRQIGDHSGFRRKKSRSMAGFGTPWPDLGSQIASKVLIFMQF